ncbi:MAG: gluconeogenesis factor YvcK family protein [Vicinamibacteraceae bacterium]
MHRLHCTGRPSISFFVGFVAFVVVPFSLRVGQNRVMRLRELHVGCFGGGTGLPSLLGGLKRNPWLRVSAVVTMFDSGGSSGVLRDELGVLPPGDVLRCTLALARNEPEARRVLLSRLPTLEHDRLGGHTGGNLLLSMMEQYSGDFIAAVDGLRTVLGCRGRVWPVSTDRASICAEYTDGTITSGEVEVDEGQARGRYVKRVWLEPAVSLHRETERAIGELDAVIIGPGSFYTSLMPTLLVRGVREALAARHVPLVLVANLLTEGSGMRGFSAGEAVARIAEVLGRPIDAVIFNSACPSPDVLAGYAAEHKEPLLPGEVPAGCEIVEGAFWTRGIARHDRRRLAYAVWTVLARRLLS